MSEPYPLPSYAAYIWAVGDSLHIQFPPLPGQEKSHTVVLPCNESGMTVAAEILKARGRETIKPTIGTKGSPIQYDIEKMLQHVKKVPPKAKQDAPKDISLDSLDIDSIDIQELLNGAR